MEQEIDRLQHLASFGLDYSSYHEELGPFVQLAQKITNSPVCEINIIDAYKQWTIARTEEELKVIPREESVCYDTIQEDEPYEITDLKDHDRYYDRSYVTGDPHFRYYCGVQLTTADDVNIGSICVLDQETKKISNSQKQQLEYLAQLIVKYLQKDRSVHQSNRKVHNMQEQFRTLNHDIRNPINGIVGIVDLLLTDDEDEQLDVSADDLLTIKDCANAIVDEIDSVLLASNDKEEVGGSTDKVLVKEVFEQVKRLNTPSAQHKSLHFSIDRQVDADYYISVYSSQRLIQIISNLVANAIKFTQKGGTVKVVYDTEEADDCVYLKIAVQDDGIGMEKQQIEKFNNGQKIVGSAGTGGEESFGIGLQHVRKLVHELNGKILARSTPGEGTDFLVTVGMYNL